MENNKNVINYVQLTYYHKSRFNNITNDKCKFTWIFMKF